MFPVISLSGVSKEFRMSRTKTIRALRGVTFDVQRGEVFSLLGPNGAGKTTLVRLLLGIIRPSEGRGTLLDHPVGDVQTKSRVGYLPENHRFPPYLTGEQVLRLFGTLSGMEPATLNARIDETIALVNMGEWRTTKIRKYSKGMMQRIGLAQAMLNTPDVLFLDEPTDGVDPIGRRDIRNMLVHLKDRGTTVFLNSHLLSEVEMISDRVAILNHGELVSIGTVDALTKRTDEVVFDVEGDLEAALAAVRATVADAAVVDGKIVVSSTDTGARNRAMDALRGAGIAIREITQRRATLEEAFMSLVEHVEN